MVNKENTNLLRYIFHHLCEAIKESKKHTKKNVPYARLLSGLFHQGYLIDSLRVTSAHDGLEEIHGNILSALVLCNMKLLKKNKVVISEKPLRVRSTKSAYLEDYTVITKHDNPELIREFIKMAGKEVGVVLTYEDLLEKKTDAHKPSKKRKRVAFDAHKIVHNPPKNKVMPYKEVHKDIEEPVCSTVLMPTRTRSGKTPHKTSSSSVATGAPVKKTKLINMILPSKIPEGEEEI